MLLLRGRYQDRMLQSGDFQVAGLQALLKDAFKVQLPYPIREVGGQVVAPL